MAALAPGAWSAPIRSSFGLHLVRVTERAPGRVPALGEVRGRVLAELQAERRRGAPGSPAIRWCWGLSGR
ncbi:MAG: peptidylprolyl isomerase [Chloroflexota bacterium]